MGLFDKIKKLNSKIRNFVENEILISNKKEKKQIENITKKQEIMAVYNYGVGGNEVKIDGSEEIKNIQENKSLIISKLTTEDTYVPEIVEGLKTVESVFDHYKPNVSVQHETPDGSAVNETFNFKNLGDFTPKKMIENSEYLSSLNVEKEQYNKILRQLMNNKILKKLVEDPDAKADLINALKEVSNELKERK